jgi:hypothetical protein
LPVGDTEKTCDRRRANADAELPVDVFEVLAHLRRRKPSEPIALARIYGGLHFRKAMEDGEQRGRRTAREVGRSFD